MTDTPTFNFDFSGQTALVTGGTRGIGENIVKSLSQCGCHVVYTGTTKSAPHHVPNTSFYTLDLSDDSSIKAFFEQAKKDHPKIDVLINNAGINIISDIRNIKPLEVEKVMSVNLLGPAKLTSKVSSIMAHHKYGRIVNISSVFGVGSRQQRSSYSASKAGLIGQTQAVALDLAKEGILANVICPGFVKTELTARMLGDKGMAEITNRIPLGRLAEPHDITPSILFLASNLNTYITGQTLVVDGGYLVA
ncbi:MAG: SDR family oxidoreductase [Candidatus Margulisbacteria bacterium]|nr:SDR family oxidoreductase [Candidatus Margulisiibacteriota bacterium]